MLNYQRVTQPSTLLQTHVLLLPLSCQIPYEPLLLRPRLLQRHAQLLELRMQLFLWVLGSMAAWSKSQCFSNYWIIIFVTIGYITINNDGLKLLFIIIRHLLKHCILKMMETTNSNPELQRPPRHMFSLHPVFEVLVLQLAVQHSAPFNTIV